MIAGFVSVILFKFVFQEMEGIGDYLVELDVLAPSFAIAMTFGWIFSKIYPPTQAAIDQIGMIEETDEDVRLSNDDILD